MSEYMKTRAVFALRMMLVLSLLVSGKDDCFSQHHPVGTNNASFTDYIDVYQRCLSGLKNTRCSMYPSCSAYAKMVFEDKPFPMAFALTADRLIRCGHDLSYYPKTFAYGYRAAVDMPDGRTLPAGHEHCTAAAVPDMGLLSYMMNSRNWQGAMDEVDRLLYLHPENMGLYACKLRCFEGLHRYEDGVYAFGQVFPNQCRDDYSTAYTAAHLYDLLGDMPEATALYEHSASLYPLQQGDKVSPYGELGILYAKSGRYGDAAEAFRCKAAADGNDALLESNLALLHEMETMHQRSPAAAMALGVIPGAGYLYSGQPGNALSALIINCMLAYACYTSFSSGNDGVGIIVGGLGISFYVGNIVGSGRSARRYNDMKYNALAGQLRSNNHFIY